VLRPTSVVFTIEDTYFDDVTVLPLGHIREPSFQLVEWYARLRAEALGIEYFEALPIHNFPIEELVGDAIQQYFRDIGRHLPYFETVTIKRILREPDDLEGPDTFLITMPMGDRALHRCISEQSLLTPHMDLVGWVLKHQWKLVIQENDYQNSWNNSRRPNYFGYLFSLPEPEAEGEFILYCGKAQNLADSMKGISRTASTPRITD
jgi:hypothetical protein